MKVEGGRPESAGINRHRVGSMGVLIDIMIIKGSSPY